jgi:hypothetical protein
VLCQGGLRGMVAGGPALQLVVSAQRGIYSNGSLRLDLLV